MLEKVYKFKYKWLKLDFYLKQSNIYKLLTKLNY